MSVMNQSFPRSVPTTTTTTMAPIRSSSSSSSSSSATSTSASSSMTVSPEYIYFRDESRFWVQRVLVPIIMIIGIIGNTITIIIMTRRRMRSSTNWYLAALAIFDMIYLIFTFILSLKHYPNVDSIDYYYYWKLYPIFTMITDASSNTSVWLTVAFTIERYIVVCHPIRGRVICTESRAKRVIFCVFIICLSITSPTPFEWVVLKKCQNNLDQSTCHMELNYSELGHNETYRRIYYNSVVFLFILLPFALLVIFNTFLIRSVHISNRERTQMVMGKDNFQKKSTNAASSAKKHLVPSTSSKNPPTITGDGASSPNENQLQINNNSTSAATSLSSRQEIRITIMLIAVVILFLLCQTPTACILVYEAIYHYEPNSNQAYLLRGLNNIFNCLMAINSAGNFILYCLLSQKYRRTFFNMFCPCLRNARYLGHASTAVNNRKNFNNHHHHHRQQSNYHSTKNTEYYSEVFSTTPTTNQNKSITPEQNNRKLKNISTSGIVSTSSVSSSIADLNPSKSSTPSSPKIINNHQSSKIDEK